VAILDKPRNSSSSKLAEETINFFAEKGLINKNNVNDVLSTVATKSVQQLGNVAAALVENGTIDSDNVKNFSHNGHKGPAAIMSGILGKCPDQFEVTRDALLKVVDSRSAKQVADVIGRESGYVEGFANDAWSRYLPQQTQRSDSTSNPPPPGITSSADFQSAVAGLKGSSFEEKDLTNISSPTAAGKSTGKSVTR
jgi:hypothetical protein